MRKIIIAICGIILAGGAQARYLSKPLIETHTVALRWGVGGTYETDLNDVYPQLESQLNSENGTYGTDEGAVVLVLARSIYENGGRFCATQVQAGNINGQRKIWIDYIKDPTFQCYTLCKPGFLGETCSERSAGVIAVKTGVLNFGTIDVKTTGEDDNVITNEVEVFSVNNQEASNIRTADHVVLGMVKLLDHGIIAAPIKIIAERDKTFSGGIHSRIISASSNGKTTLLCVRGYVSSSDGKDCVLKTQQVTEQYCKDFQSGYSEEKHIKYVPEGLNCMKFICAEDNYGFKQGSKDCIPCATTRTQGINEAGECKQCTGGKMFKDGDCKDSESLSRQHLLNGLYSVGKCWMKSSPSEYKDCVLCSKGQHWNAAIKKCENKNQSVK
ncbi:MAG: hypothetical protein II179_00330 [Alphaproteobacteria bacterium]|nr:hypothetical protein [Alphaproteobacteria bacterium]